VLGCTAGRHGVDGTAWYPRRPSIDSGAVSGGAAAPVQPVARRVGRRHGRRRLRVSMLKRTMIELDIDVLVRPRRSFRCRATRLS
jgi:hypothetical protein